MSSEKETDSVTVSLFIGSSFVEGDEKADQPVSTSLKLWAIVVPDYPPSRDRMKAREIQTERFLCKPKRYRWSDGILEEMNPRLTAILGPLQGSTIQLTEQEISIGRDPSNTLSISDLLLSRRHCLIKRDGERFTIADLDSLNGIFVNRIRTKERILQSGDQVELGESLFVFLDDAGAAEAKEPVFTAQSTMRLRVEDAVYLKPQLVGGQPLAGEKMTRDLNSLLHISNVLYSAQSLADFQNKLVEQVFQALPGDRCAMFLSGEDLSELTSSFGLERRSGNTISIGSSIAREAFREKAGIVYNGVSREDGVRSVICVPLIAYQKSFGALYLDTSDPNTRFDEGQLQLFAGIAGIAAVALKNVMQTDRLKDENRRLLAEIGNSMVGDSEAIRKVYELIARIAPFDSTVLICGETGTGKELAARAIHLNSSRAHKPFVAINCAALTETLLESELFGHEKGAFTGAIAQKKGKLEIAEGGTSFLDEISEFAPAFQAKMLRVLQEREFERVGGTRTIKLNVRFIAATNKNLEEAVKAGTFRQDLYFRLNVVSIRMPALRERREDIPLLANYFSSKHSKGRPFAEISPEALQCLTEYDWPGNVRELENTIERAMVLGCSDKILPEDLPDLLLEIERPSRTSAATYYERMKESKRQLIQNAFDQSGGDHNEAAKLLGIHPNSLHRMIRNLKLHRR